MFYKTSFLLNISLFFLSSVCEAYPATWKYHHLGVPTNEHNKKELYDSKWKYYTWGYGESEFNIQMHRFDSDAPFPKLITTKPHIAFRVPNLKEAIKGRNVVWGPIESIKSFCSDDKRSHDRYASRIITNDFLKRRGGKKIP